MDATFHQTIPNDFIRLHGLMEEATQFLERQGVDERGVYLLNLGLEEVVTNIIKYGYDHPGTYGIEVTLTIRANEVTLLIVDDGHAFDPIAHERKPVPANVEEREIGGLGIFLLKKQLDRMEYRREAGRNILELKTRRTLAQPAG